MRTRMLMLIYIFCLAVLIILGSCATSQNPDKMVLKSSVEHGLIKIMSRNPE